MLFLMLINRKTKTEIWIVLPKGIIPLVSFVESLHIKIDWAAQSQGEKSITKT